MASSMESGRTNVMMLPSLGKGHLIPFIQLAMKLAARGLTVTFVVTFHHMPSLKNKVEAARESGLDIHLVEMEIPTDELALGKVTSNSVQWHKLPPLHTANESLQGPFHAFLQRFIEGEINSASALAPPVCLIADFLLGWASAVAQNFGIPRVCFEASGMFSESVHQIAWDTLPRNLPRSPSGRYVVPGLPKEIRLTGLQMLPELPEATTDSARYPFWKRQREGNKQSWRIIANTFYELEAEYVEHFQRVNGTIRTIGPLLPPEAFEDRPCRIAPVLQIGVNTDEDKCFQWLDAQAEKSVLYISFGSENSISIAQMEELAMGLEASGVKFLWVLRRPSDAGSKAFSSALDFLPEGFHSRVAEMRDQGFMILGWAPQLRILAHPSTGGFLSHCGWNAVLETTTMGVPMIAWPLYAEQHFNSKFVVDEIQIALEAPQRVNQNWLVIRDDVEIIVKMLMVEEEGKKLRERVTELKEDAKAAVARGGSSHKNFELFVSEIMSLGLRTREETPMATIS